MKTLQTYVTERIGLMKQFESIGLQELPKTGYDIEIEPSSNNTEFVFLVEKEVVASIQFSTPDEFRRKSYIPVQTVEVIEKFRRKGIYTTILAATDKVAKLAGFQGIISYQYDLDSGEFERQPAATAVWEKLVKNRKARRHTIFDDEYDEYVVHYTFL